MSRFDATTPDDRQSLVADAIAAHRERGSGFCTIEAGAPPSEEPRMEGDGAGGGEGADGGDGEDATEESDEPTPAWVQYSQPEGQLNLDCTDEEYDRITAVLSSYPSFTVVEQASPEDAEGRNLRIAARADDERIAEAVEQLFREGFDYDETFRLWATEI